jgi:branched-chain amino acid transport system ATP-binding protein
MSVLEIKGLTKSFGGVLAVSNVDLLLDEGEIHGLIGPNGAGKTTLLNLISGLLLPDRGEILFKGVNVTRRPASLRARMGLARTFQITNIFKEFTVRTNLELALLGRYTNYRNLWTKVPPSVSEKAFAVACEVGLTSQFGLVAGQLSHGEQRALEIGLALCSSPQLLLLDEPLAGMGPKESEWMVELIRRIANERSLTVLIVEHDLDAVFRLAQRVTVMVYGQVIASGAPEIVRSNPDVQRAYTGS